MLNLLHTCTHLASSGGFTYHQTTPILTKEALNVVHNATIVVAQRVLSSGATKALTKTHGILMIFAWPILAALAIYFPAFMKPVLNRKGEWFQVSCLTANNNIYSTSTYFLALFVLNIATSSLHVEFIGVGSHFVHPDFCCAC